MTLASEGLRLPQKQHTLRYDAPEAPSLPDGVSVSVEHNVPDDEGELTYNEDGSVTVNEIKPKTVNKKNHNANLADGMDETDLDIIASDLLEAIADDIRSRLEWETTFNRGIDLLGLKIENPTSEVTGGGNISKCKDPLLLEAVLRYQSNFNAEMLPADGPVKVRDDKVQAPATPQPVGAPEGMTGTPPGVPGAPAQPFGGMTAMGGPELPAMPKISRTELAEAFSKDFNHYLTVIDKVYYPDTDRMSFSQALGGCAFKKVYRDPVDERPISRFVMANHLIVNNGASSLYDAKRITHDIPNMSHLTMKQMMAAGAYREIELSQPMSEPGAVDQKIAETQGTAPRTDRPEDRDYNVYECYCYRNLNGYEQKKDLPVPYRITIERDSRKVLEIRRNWKQGDKMFKPRRRFVKYPLFPGLGFYDYGYVHILGNTTRVLSAIESLMVDQGMFANFPGGLIDKMAQKQETNQIRPGPGGFKPIDTGGRPITQVVMPMPYKDVSPNLMTLAKGIQDGGRKLGSIAELPLGEGRADVPVGTVIALIEQSQKLLSAVHKRNHAAQQEEFEILKELFAEDPSALSRFTKDPARKWETKEEFEDLDLVPASDPNISSHILRLMRAQAVLTIMQQAPPGLMNVKEGITRAFRVLGEEDIESLFLPPPPPGSAPPSPHIMDAQAKQAQLVQKAQSDQMNAQVKLHVAQLESQDKQRSNQTQLTLESAKLKIEAMKHVADIQNGITPNTVAPPGAMGGG